MRLTYSSTTDALKDLSKAKEEASVSRIIGIDPEITELAGGRYKLQWKGMDNSFMLVGAVSAHDVMIHKEVPPSSFLIADA
jgi:hypothetical protein